MNNTLPEAEETSLAETLADYVIQIHDEALSLESLIDPIKDSLENDNTAKAKDVRIALASVRHIGAHCELMVEELEKLHKPKETTVKE